MKPPPESFAAITRKSVESHEWDSIHSFVTLLWDGDNLQPRLLAGIALDVPPDSYPELMMRMAIEDFSAGEEIPVAYLLQFEAFVATAPVDPSPAEAAQFERDRRERNLHKRQDAREISTAYCADIYGRVWSATRERVTNKVEEYFYEAPDIPLGGRFFHALRAIAQATGVMAGEYPGSMQN